MSRSLHVACMLAITSFLLQSLDIPEKPRGKLPQWYSEHCWERDPYLVES